MRVIITGGGTAGHINPALAIAEIIKEKNPDAEFLFIGTKKGLETSIVPKAGIDIKYVNVIGIPRSITPKLVKALYLAVKSVGEAKKIIKEFKPNLIVGTGGYVSYPVIKAGAKLKIPTILHESNAVPGLAINKLQGVVSKVLLNFTETKKYIIDKSKAVRVGNPLRQGFSIADREKAREEYKLDDKTKFVLVFGGSLGSQRIDETMLEIFRVYAEGCKNIKFLLGTGKRYYDEIIEKAKEYGIDKLNNVEILEYINDMPERMSASDLVVCRSGAMTVSEIALMGKASIFIPSPNVTNNHQYKNAKVLADKNGAVLIEEKNLSADLLANTIISLCRDDEKRKDIEKNALKFSEKEANEIIYREIMSLL